MPVLVIASSEPRAGRSLVAAALAYRLARDGKPVTLARLSGDDGAAPDAATFAALEGLTAPAAPVDAAAAAKLTGNVVLEAPAGPVAALATSLKARVLAVGGPPSSPVDAPKDALAGSILTRVPAAEVATVARRAGVLAVFPEDRILAAPSVTDIAAALRARRLAPGEESATFDRVMIGTVASDAAAPYFGNRERTCVVTRFDKTDIQLAALSTGLQCLVLTGGGAPSPYLLDRVADHRPDVAVLLAEDDTVASMRAIEPLFTASRFDGAGKLARAVELLDEAGVQIGF
jgi:BioD-like phosphotransacetylase family protein